MAPADYIFPVQFMIQITYQIYPMKDFLKMTLHSHFQTWKLDNFVIIGQHTSNKDLRFAHFCHHPAYLKVHELTESLLQLLSKLSILTSSFLSPSLVLPSATSFPAPNSS